LIPLLLNDAEIALDLPAGRRALDALRGTLRLTGTKEGCREGDCGACCVLWGVPESGAVVYRVVPACLLPCGELHGTHLVTIEGLSPAGGSHTGLVRGGPARAAGLGNGLTPVQEAFLEFGAAQCGFCTPGFVVALTGYLLSAESLDPLEAEEAVAGQLCRCTGYSSVRRALARLCEQLDGDACARTAGDPVERVRWLVAEGVLPEAFLEAPRRLAALARRAGSASLAPPAPLAARSPAAPPMPCAPAAPPAPDAPPIPCAPAAPPMPCAPPAPPAPASRGPRIVGGATDLYVQRPEEIEDASDLLLLSRRADLRGIRVEAGRCRIKGAATIEELRRCRTLRAVLPALDGWLRRVASLPVRARATLAGNLVNASPIGDLAILLLALDAEVTLEGGGAWAPAAGPPMGRPSLAGAPMESARRTMALRAFFHAYKQTARRSGEIIVEIAFDLPGADTRLSFQKVSCRPRLDIASVNGAARIAACDGHIVRAELSAGGVAPVPLYLARASAHLAGRRLSAAAVREAAEIADGEISPIDDIRGSALYKRLLCRRILYAHFLECFPEAMGGDLP